MPSIYGPLGDMVGPASATDNAVPRFDGTGGKTLQASVVTVADTTGAISINGHQAITDPTGAPSGLFLKDDGTWAAAGGGSIGGATGSTDNALIRADGAGGSTVQASPLVIADLNGNITGPTSSTDTTTAGQDFGNQPANDAVEILSDNAADKAKNVTIIGTTNGTDTVVVEVIATDGADGTTAVTTTKVDWGIILAVKCDACAGTLTIREASGNATITTIAPAATSKGVDTGTVTCYDRYVLFAGSAATTKQVGFKGTNAAGATIYGSQALTGTIYAVSNEKWNTITEYYVGDLESTRTCTIVNRPWPSINGIRMDGAGDSELEMADGKTLSVANSMTLSGTDGSTLAIGSGGSLASAAFVASTALLKKAAVAVTPVGTVIAASDVFHKVDCSGGAASVDEITGGTAGDILILTPNAAADVLTLTHTAADTAHHIQTAWGGNVVLYFGEICILFRQGNRWKARDINAPNRSQSASTGGADTTINCSLGHTVLLSVDSSTHLNFSNLPVGNITLICTNSGAGYALTIETSGSNLFSPGAVNPPMDTANGAVNTLHFVSDGTNAYLVNATSTQTAF